MCFLGFRYHHTGPVSGFFALRESLAILAEKVKGQFTPFSRYFSERRSQPSFIVVFRIIYVHQKCIKVWIYIMVCLLRVSYCVISRYECNC